ncbi:aminotransferase class I/II-fold pyridoxal phosphate-dependent enzyme [Streptomyces sp. NA02950]|uniref:aminotransferase class I/II-fold pyridoxal phosphate-dependent enzyme n=1 Tax=Streptomyces sp. NA02950 TaxID=2742137 RepID=UPI0015911849|nr:aminotransferase class I/II-fold pyridoxal phosphate-dependent enzyme [Streptomyces sp. NA02950]QKV90548.1 aminotransferase class I/II-fold pyridoxal phosphate-dependent enzyme [Streptomyces sp. NA02950]
MAGRTLDDYGRQAREVLEPSLAEFLAAEEEAAAENRAVFERAGLKQGRSARPGPPDTAVKILHRGWSAPLVVGPLAGLARPKGAPAVARAAGAVVLPAVVDASTPHRLADLAAAGGGPLWLRTYVTGGPDATPHRVAEAAEAGCAALVLSLRPHSGDRPPRGAAAGWADVERLRASSPLPLIVAGAATAADARCAVDAGADGLVTGSLRALPALADALAGRCPVLLDGGVRGGADVLVALASGADAVLVGQPVLDGLLVGGEAGVTEVLDGLVRELRDAMTFTATPSVAEAHRAAIAAGPGPAPAAPRRDAPGPGGVPGKGEARSAELRKTDLHPSLCDPVLDTMNFLNEVTHRYPDAISFAPGRPYDGFFDTEEIFTHLRRYLDHLAARGRTPQDIRTAMYQYGPTAGQIREIVADSLRADEDIDVPAESIVVTVGAQEAMLLVLRALISGPDDVLLVASPCYVGIMGAARLLDVAVTPVQEGEDGFSCAELEAAILGERARGRRPRALYVVPDHSNPSGTTMDAPTRAALLELAERHGILIIEDSPYRRVSPGVPLPTLKSLDRSRTVIHLGSFAKTVFPGARVGFAVADQRVLDDTGRTELLADELARIKSMVTVNTSSLSQAAVAGALLAAEGRLSVLNADAAAYYGNAMQTTLRNLDARLPAARRAALGVRWNEPTGGFFLTVQVPFRADNAALTRSAQEFGVIWTPMNYFYPRGGGHHALRLSTSYLTTADIEKGTARLARFIEAQSAARKTS